MAKISKEERLKHLNKEIEKAEEEEDEVYLKYLTRIKGDLIIHNYEGGLIIWQSGTPPPPPPYGGG